MSKVKPTYRNIQYIPCPDCNTTGFIDGKKCNNCAGTGEWIIARNENRAMVKINKETE